VTAEVGFERYRAVWRRFDLVVRRLTDMGKKKEADYLMIKFFIFFEQPERLEEFAANAEDLLANDGW